MLLAFAMVSALLAVRNGAAGQVIDCAMTDGSALLGSLTWGLHAAGLWKDETGANSIDSGSAWYDTYETADGKWIAIGALEPQFRAALCARLEIEDPDNDSALKATLTALFRQHPRLHWCDLLEGTDACFAPVLTLAEAPAHPHNAFRGTFANIGGVTQPAPAPRYSGTATDEPRPMRDEADALLAELGYDAERILRSGGTALSARSKGRDRPRPRAARAAAARRRARAARCGRRGSAAARRRGAARWRVTGAGMQTNSVAISPADSRTVE